MLEILKQENNFGNETCDSIIKFIERCQEVNKLTKWTIAIKTAGRAKANEGKGILKSKESNLPIDITMTVRRGPSTDDGVKYFREKFVHGKFLVHLENLRILFRQDLTYQYYCPKHK
ncbi:MAG: hypothetical protein IPH04_04195 [Saprospirales bacterium]|nr:hypothetical protein [Saprospirales bacterium]